MIFFFKLKNKFNIDSTNSEQETKEGRAFISHCGSIIVSIVYNKQAMQLSQSCVRAKGKTVREQEKSLNFDGGLIQLSRSLAAAAACMDERV